MNSLEVALFEVAALNRKCGDLQWRNFQRLILSLAF